MERKAGGGKSVGRELPRVWQQVMSEEHLLAVVGMCLRVFLVCKIRLCVYVWMCVWIIHAHHD